MPQQKQKEFPTCCVAQRELELREERKKERQKKQRRKTI